MLRRCVWSLLASVGLAQGTLWAQTNEPPLFLPPLLPVPQQAPASPASGSLAAPSTTAVPPAPPSRSIIGEYHPAYSYLPESAPSQKLPPCPCLPLGKTWFDVRYLYATTEGLTVPPLATTGPLGTLGSMMFHSTDLPQAFRAGLRFEAGHWLDRCQNLGIDGSFLFLGMDRTGLAVYSPGTFPLFRPSIAADGTPTGVVIASPSVGPGAITLASDTFFLTGDVNLRLNFACESKWRIDAIVGYRVFSLQETITLTSVQHPQNILSDRFRTENLFHGVQLGLCGQYRWQVLYVDMFGKVALGGDWRSVELQGGNSQTGPGGFLVPSHQMGRVTETDFAVLPEVGCNLGVQLTDFTRVFVGYTFLYINNIARPGEQIELTGSSVRRERTTDFWLQGIHFGIDLRF